MRNKIILIGVLLMVIAISGCVNSDVDAINQIMPKLSDNIESGDYSFNTAVNAVNSNNTDKYLKTQTAINKYNNANSNIEDILKHSKSLNDAYYVEYINLISQELDFKINASSSLLEISRMSPSKTYYDYNEYVSEINYYMGEGVKIQKKRNTLVNNNPTKFS
jgi:outer membrane murein-binding lipoprotein Lpp